jgi:proteasome lid subunit RPN8/RPN11
MTRSGVVHLSSTLVQQMLQHARRQAPLECCGLLAGTAGRIVSIVEARNELESPVAYRVDSRDHFAALRQARLSGLSIVGGFHSHPRTAPVPSETDRAEAWPAFLYVIVSLAAAYAACPIRAWRLDGGNFAEVSLVTSAEEVASTPCETDSP